MDNKSAIASTASPPEPDPRAAGPYPRGRVRGGVGRSIRPFGLREAPARAMAGGGAPGRSGLEPLPDFMSLPRDEEGRPIISTPRVTALVEAKEACATELGTLDAAPRSITRGQLVMSRIAALSQQRRCATTRRG